MTEMAIQDLRTIGQKAKAAARQMRLADAQAKNEALEVMAQAIEAKAAQIIEANQEDLAKGQEAGLTEALLERLTLTPDRIQGMANGLRQMASLPDPLLVTDKEWINRDGLRISRRRVPLGVIGIIYESRPNVTVDAAGLTLKAGNSTILRGGKEALTSNQTIVAILQDALAETQLPREAVQLITDPSRELASQFMQMNDYVDCLIPRGSAGLIQAVLKQATVPVIETGEGNCHLYIHEAADFDKALKILINGKTQRPSVCNALENLIIDEQVASDYLPKFVDALAAHNVEVVGDHKACSIDRRIALAQEEDFAQEFLDLKLAVKITSSYAEAVEHIEAYSTGHSDAIITENYQVAQDFMNDIDSAAVYVNASTRFTDGEVFGFGGEIGISTQKLHARGPMGLEALTSYKYTIQGDGQIRS